MPSESPLAKKLLLTEKMQARFINTPAGFWHDFGRLPKGVALQSGGRDTADWVLVFAKTGVELLEHGPGALESLRPGGILWAAFPKKKKKQTTLTPDSGWVAISDEGFEPAGTVNIDDEWTAMRWKPV
jgi:hypothetical protein